MLNHILLNKWPLVLAAAMLVYAVRRVHLHLPGRRSSDAAVRDRSQREVAWGIVLLSAALALGANAAGLIKLPTNSAPGHLTYVIPEGWTDLSPGSAALERGDLPESFRQLLRADHQALALDWRPGEPPTPKATMFATHHVGGPVSVEMMERTWGEIKSVRSARVEQGPQMLPWRSGCGRLIARLATPNGDVAMVVYFIPSGEHSFAMLSFSTAFDALDEYRELFESTAQRTAETSAS